MPKSTEIAAGRGVPWATLVATAWCCLIFSLQWRWGGFGYAPTFTRMGASDRSLGLILSGWFAGSVPHAVFSALALALAYGHMERSMGWRLATAVALPTIILVGLALVGPLGWCGPGAVAAAWVGAYASSHGARRNVRSRWSNIAAVACTLSIVGVAASPDASAVGVAICVAYGVILGRSWIRPTSMAPQERRRWIAGALAVFLAVTNVSAFIGIWLNERPWELVNPIALEPRTVTVAPSGLQLVPVDAGLRANGEPEEEPDVVVTLVLPPKLGEFHGYDHTTRVHDDRVEVSLRPFASEAEVLYGIQPEAMIHGEPPPDVPLWAHVWVGHGLDCEPIEPKFDARLMRTDAAESVYFSERGIDVRTRTLEAPFGCAYLAVYAWTSAPHGQHEAVEEVLGSFRFHEA